LANVHDRKAPSPQKKQSVKNKGVTNHVLKAHTDFVVNQPVSHLSENFNFANKSLHKLGNRISF